MPSLAFTADSRQTEAGRLYNRSEEDETRIPLQKAIDDADYEHGHRVHELDFLTAFRSPRLRQPPKRLDKRVPQDGIGARLGHPRPSLRCPGQADGAALVDLVHVYRAPAVLQGVRLLHSQLSIMVDALLHMEVPSEEAVESQERVDQGLGSGAVARAGSASVARPHP